MSRATKTLLALLLACVLSGCIATGEKFRREIPAGPEEALLYIFRPSGFIGVAQRPDVKVDGQPLGSLVSGSFLVKKVGIGRHELLLTGEGNPFTWNYPDRLETFVIMTSGNYYFRYAPSSSMRTPNVMVHSYSFYPVSESQAMEELINLNHAK